ncbi:DUF1579 domain-containing protein [Paraflavitalea pollutisoli]|uniref:DUF1579 domain-containing protein n=1 Tax=Paraflavitalea pollutisoli TaxID=3034143 RepID=UPI0023EE0DAF|nr:DUF1579 domain-containing protein [Paraflavitalea sp. H1-2-19X]
MKRLTFIVCSSVMLAISACNDTPNTNSPAKNDSTVTTGTDSGTTAGNTPVTAPDTAAVRIAMETYATPGNMHKMLATQDGKWNAEITTWWAPDGPPQKTIGVSVNKMVLGGRYQQSSFTGKFDNMPFEGKGTLAYDNTKKVFVSTWIDNMGTGVMILEGPWDAATKTISLSGSMTDPSTGKDCKVREIMTFTDDQHQKMEMFAAPGGQKEYKTMEILFSRK